MVCRGGARPRHPECPRRPEATAVGLAACGWECHTPSGRILHSQHRANVCKEVRGSASRASPWVVARVPSRPDPNPARPAARPPRARLPRRSLRRAPCPRLRGSPLAAATYCDAVRIGQAGDKRRIIHPSIRFEDAARCGRQAGTFVAAEGLPMTPWPASARPLAAASHPRARLTPGGGRAEKPRRAAPQRRMAQVSPTRNITSGPARPSGPEASAKRSRA